ncbi:MAG: TIM barrel protein, partial [Spirochaetaceae bacterium]
MSRFKFSVGPWNIHEGADPFGPAVRGTVPFAEKAARFAELGIHAVQFHDDDVVEAIDQKSPSQVEAAAAETKRILDDHGMAAEFVAPRLWESPRTVDGAFTSNNPEDRRYALERTKRAADLCRVLECDLLGFWFAREGTEVLESKDPVASVRRLVDAVNEILEYDKTLRIFIEPKPNEPVDRSFLPTQGHAMAISAATSDPARVGGLVESAHATLAGLDPALEMAFALSLGKLFGVHLNDQNGLRFDQDKSFGSENLRSAFNQIMVLVDNDYGSKGEYIGLDVKARRTQPAASAYTHLANSLRMIQLLEEKARSFDQAKR